MPADEPPPVYEDESEWRIRTSRERRPTGMLQGILSRRAENVVLSFCWTAIVACMLWYVRPSWMPLALAPLFVLGCPTAYHLYQRFDHRTQEAELTKDLESFCEQNTTLLRADSGFGCYELKLPFDSDSPEFTRGVEVGMLYARLHERLHLQRLAVRAVVHSSNAEMVLRIAEALDCSAWSEELDDDWLSVTFGA